MVTSENNIKPYLTEEEIKRAKMCISNIDDKLLAIATEVNNTEHPYKGYLKEKIDSLLHDAKVIFNMCSKE